MYVSLECVVRSLGAENLDEVELDAGGPHQVRLRFRRMEPIERRKVDDDLSAFCRATGEWSLSEDLLDKFQTISLEWGQRAVEEPGLVEVPTSVDDEGAIHQAVHMGLYEPSVSEFRNDVFNFLLSTVRRSVRLLRWRAGIAGPHNPVRVRGERDSWSLDGVKWYPLSTLIFPDSEPVELKDSNSDFVQDVCHLLQSDSDEPLAHQLFREAWQQRRENPRSALVIGIVAAEAGVKRFIATAVPQSAWLIEETQSPPLIKIITNYLPMLFSPSEDGYIWLMTKSAYRAIQRGVEARNKIVHTGSVPTDLEDVLTRSVLEDLLNCVRDLLWLLDYYAGAVWAFERIHPESVVRKIKES